MFSTDDFFFRGDVYDFNPEELSDAHAWNKQRGALIKVEIKLVFQCHNGCLKLIKQCPTLLQHSPFLSL